MSAQKLVVCMFSGGRGSATITRELLRHPNVELNLLVNAYDDGLSTGELRDFIPGMLGPSDFRKNLSYLLDLYSVQQFALERVIEYRLPKEFGQKHLEELNDIVGGTAHIAPLLPFVQENLAMLEGEVRAAVVDFLRVFLEFARTQPKGFNFVDCSLGNLVFAGAYLTHGRDFNRATDALARICGSKANLINVTRGENRVLVALKENGEVLGREAQIVNPQSPARIVDLFLLEKPLSAEQSAALESLSLEDKRAKLRGFETSVKLSDKAREALMRADVIVYAPGTQYSSLLPSYMTDGMKEAVAKSRAKVKAFVCNLYWDHDIQGRSAVDLVDAALHSFGDPKNASKLVTHVLFNVHDTARSAANAIPLGLPDAKFANIKMVRGKFENPARPGLHSGRVVVKTLTDLYEQEVTSGTRQLDVYVDLNARSIALNYLIQEFLELPWHDHFSKVRLTLNRVTLPPLDLPPHLEVRTSERDAMFSDVDVFYGWLEGGDTAYLATIAGDGEYRFADVLSSLLLLERSSFGAVFGSRNQSRKQFMRSLNAAYGESDFLYYTSWAAALGLAAAFGAMHQVIFSDPLTGFRVFKRSVLTEALREHPTGVGKRAEGAMGITRAFVQAGIEIAEVPVSYRTFKGFTNVRWRVTRGLKNAWSAMRPRS